MNEWLVTGEDASGGETRQEEAAQNHVCWVVGKGQVRKLKDMELQASGIH